MDAEIARRRGQAGADTATSTVQLLAQQYGTARTGAGDKPEVPAAVPTDFFGRVRVPVQQQQQVPPRGPLDFAAAADDVEDTPQLPETEGMTSKF